MFDALDEAIVAALQKDSRLSHRAIARQLDSTQPTISARIQRLEDAGVILGYTVRLQGDPVAPAAGALHAVCHWCKRRSAEPVWWNGDGHHPFCCTTCRSAYVAKHERLGKGL